MRVKASHAFRIITRQYVFFFFQGRLVEFCSGAWWSGKKMDRGMPETYQKWGRVWIRISVRVGITFKAWTCPVTVLGWTCSGGSRQNCFLLPPFNKFAMQQDRWHFASESLQAPVGSVYSQSKYGDQYGLKTKKQKKQQHGIRSWNWNNYLYWNLN